MNFSMLIVHIPSHSIEFILGISRELDALRQVLTQEFFGILIGASLPQAVKVRKKDRNPHSQLLVLSHHLAWGICDTFPHWLLRTRLKPSRTVAA